MEHVLRAEKRARERALQFVSCNILRSTGKQAFSQNLFTVIGNCRLASSSSQSYGPSRTYSQRGSLSFRPKGFSLCVLYGCVSLTSDLIVTIVSDNPAGSISRSERPHTCRNWHCPQTSRLAYSISGTLLLSLCQSFGLEGLFCQFIGSDYKHMLKHDR